MDPNEEITQSYDIAAMEHEHTGQLSLLNDLKTAVRSGAGDNVAYSLLHELVEHTNLHFLSEQLAMRLHAYEAYESHFVEHERLMTQLQNLKSDLAAGNAADKEGLIEALRDWLVVHIQTADKALADYLGKRAASQSG